MLSNFQERSEDDERFVPGVTTDLSLDYNDNDETDIANISFYSKDHGTIPLKGLCKNFKFTKSADFIVG